MNIRQKNRQGTEDGKGITQNIIGKEFYMNFNWNLVTEKDIEEHFAQYGKVVEITFARKFGKMMKVYKKQDELNKTICKQEAKIRIIAQRHNKDVDQALIWDKTLQKLIKEDRKMEKEIRENYPRISSYDDLHAFGAFVIFDDALACSKCYFDYKNSNRLVYQNRLKFLEKYNIKWKYADDPVNINWDNLEVRRWESFWRSLTTVLIASVS